jgi:hypothetical protein
MGSNASHFKGKGALEHVVQAQKDGLIGKSEIHGAEPSGAISGFADALRETALLLGFLWELLLFLGVELGVYPVVMLPVALGWLAWKGGRGALLGWSRLERLHRIVEEEKYEIEHHRQQEREELRELYRVKGFEGKLLEEVLDVLMADGERLLRVMVEEELGLSLHSEEHPLKQGCGAALGVAVAAALVLGALFIHPLSPWITLPILFIASAALSASLLRNRPLPTIVWQLALAVLSLGIPFLAWNLSP